LERRFVVVSGNRYTRRGSRHAAPQTEIAGSALDCRAPRSGN
jgi:hypothetical protein